MVNVFKLDNGLRVTAQNIPSVNSVAVGLWIKNGSRNENAVNNGISHFIEHMLFKGTNKRTSKEIAESIEDVGGQLNGFTGKETTCFYVKVLKNHLDLSLDVLSDMLFFSKFSEEEIEKEKSVIAEEINMTEDAPEDLLADIHCMSIWSDDSLSLPILGDAKTINTFNRDLLLKYVKSHYIPENSVLSICGNINMDEIEDLASKYFGSWEGVNREITNYSIPEIKKEHIWKKKKIEQLHLSLGIPGLPEDDEDLYSLIVLNNILGGTTSSILFQKLREEMGLCYNIYSYISAYCSTGILSVYAALSPKSAEQAVFNIKAEIEKFMDSSIDESRLYKAKEQLKGSYFLGNETPGSKMFSNGKSLLTKNKILTEEEIMEKIDNISLESLERVKNKTLKKGIYNSAFVGDEFDFENCKKIITI